ncbi:MAG: 16S rRNA (uracil(1498)-N(3))-methyltransferase [Pseudomonadota bacterium]
MAPRFYADLPLLAGESVFLPAPAARHVQVLRMQPGDVIRLFNGQGDGAPGSEGEFEATIAVMGRSDVQVTIGAYTGTKRELGRTVHVAVGMPANERMDWLVEKATELGVASIQPLMAERSVLRLKGERADKKVAHWRGIAIAAAEQCGRNRVPFIHPASTMSDWLTGLPAPNSTAAASDRANHTDLRLLLSLADGSQALHTAASGSAAITFLSGPEGGLTASEEADAAAKGFMPVNLGPRILRAETAPLACLAWIAESTC